MGGVSPHHLSLLEWLVKNRRLLKLSKSGLYYNKVTLDFGRWRGIRYVHMRDEMGQEYIISDPFLPDKTPLKVSINFFKSVWQKIWNQAKEPEKSYNQMTLEEKIHFQFELIFSQGGEGNFEEPEQSPEDLNRVFREISEKLRGIK